MKDRATLYDLIRNKVHPGETIALHVHLDGKTFDGVLSSDDDKLLRADRSRDPIVALMDCLTNRPDPKVAPPPPPEVRYWRHLQTGDVFTTPGTTPIAGGATAEITEQEYLQGKIPSNSTAADEPVPDPDIEDLLG